MKKNDTYEYCKYYKGEDKSPFEHFSNADRFWALEEQYWHDTDFNHEEFEGMAKRYISDNPNVKNYMTSNAPIQQKGFVMFADLMLQKWCPMEETIIFDY